MSKKINGISMIGARAEALMTLIARRDDESGKDKSAEMIERIMGVMQDELLRVYRDELTICRLGRWTSPDSQLYASPSGHSDSARENMTRPNTMIEDTWTQDRIADWANGVFGKSTTPIRTALRANEELAELLTKLITGDEENAAEEIADVVIILSRLASDMGLDLQTEINRKMKVNLMREWKSDGTGHGYHVCLEPEPTEPTTTTCGDTRTRKDGTQVVCVLEPHGEGTFHASAGGVYWDRDAHLCDVVYFLDGESFRCRQQAGHPGKHVAECGKTWGRLCLARYGIAGGLGMKICRQEYDHEGAHGVPQCPSVDPEGAGRCSWLAGHGGTHASDQTGHTWPQLEEQKAPLEPETCSAKLASQSGGYFSYCRLSVGHMGIHKSKAGYTWGGEVEDGRCGAGYESEKDYHHCCTLETEHEGPHQDEDTKFRWGTPPMCPSFNVEGGLRHCCTLDVGHANPHLDEKTEHSWGVTLL